MRKFIAVAAITIIASIAATTAALAITGSIGSATASTATSSAFGPVEQRQLQTLYAISKSLKNIDRMLGSRASFTLMGELKAINSKLGTSDAIGETVLGRLEGIERNTR